MNIVVKASRTTIQATSRLSADLTSNFCCDLHR